MQQHGKPCRAGLLHDEPYSGVNENTCHHVAIVAALKTKSCHDGNFFVTDNTVDCHYKVFVGSAVMLWLSLRGHGGPFEMI